MTVVVRHISAAAVVLSGAITSPQINSLNVTTVLRSFGFSRNGVLKVCSAVYGFPQNSVSNPLTAIASNHRVTALVYVVF